MYMLLLLALIVLNAASSKAEVYATDVPPTSKTVLQIAQDLRRALTTLVSFSEIQIRERYWRLSQSQLNTSDRVWYTIVCGAILGTGLWTMSGAAARNDDTMGKASEETGGRAPSLWAAWKVNPEMGTCSIP